MEKLKSQSPDLTQESIKQIGSLFPDVITESYNDDGDLVYSIDFDALCDDLSDSIVEGKRERYQFTWPGKAKAKLEARTPCNKTIRPVPEKSVDWDTTRNLYIEGDNLEALKIIRETYAGKVKLIYIDPPYNTGHDFIYDDDFSQTQAEYAEQSGEYDEEGGRLVANLESNGRFHSDWCSMMYPRLLLARDMLTPDGAIFISIDDNESANLRKICDEVFGAGNFLTDFIWEKRTTRENRRSVSVNHDVIVCYLRDKNRCYSAIGLLPMAGEALDRYSNPDNDSRGPWTSVSTTAQSGHATRSQFYEYAAPSGKTFSPSPGNCWRYTQKKMDELVADGRIWFGADGRNFPRYKKFLSEGRQGLTPFTMLKADEVDTTDIAKRELATLFDGAAPFDTPKPVRLMNRILTIASDPDSIVLDFFSGSASMAHAVMQKNAEDGGNRRFILVQIPESAGAGFDTLCDVGEERVRRAGKKILEEIEESNRQLKLGEDPKQLPDVGFRVLRVDESCLKDTYATPAAYAQASLDDLIDNMNEDVDGLALLFQVLPKFRIPYSARIETREIAGKTVYAVEGNMLLACFDEEVSTEAVEAIAKEKPFYAVFRDASMKDDATVANLEELFKTFSPDTIRRVI